MTKRGFWAAVAAAVLLLTMLGSAAAVSAEATTLACWSFEGGTPEEDVPGGDKDTGYAAVTGSGTLTASVNGTDGRKLEWSKEPYDKTTTAAVMTGGTKNPWAVGAYVQVQVSTVGMEQVYFSAQLGGTKKGPRDWKLQISTDGSSFTDVPDAVYAITDNRKMEQAYSNVMLPAAAANQQTLCIRMVVTSGKLIGGGALSGSTGGETAVNQILVSSGPAALPTVAAGTSQTADSSAMLPTLLIALGGVVVLGGGITAVVLLKKKHS